MIIDFENEPAPFADEIFDVCIVGAGAAGLTIAHQLIGFGHRVLLIEGGGLSRWERKSQRLNKTYNVGESFDGAHCGRFRGIGGTTSAWAGQVAELDEVDFLDRKWIDGSSWPIKKADLERFYVRARELEGTQSLHHDDSEVWKEIKTKEPPLSEDLHISFSRYCPEKKFAKVFAATTKDERLKIILHANALEMIPLPGTGKIESLRFRSLEGRESTCSAHNFILCLGGIESSRFLLNQKFAPWNEHDLVGRNFQDHVQCFAADVLQANTRSPNWPYGPWRLRGQYLPKIKMNQAAQEKYEVLNVSGMIEYSDGIYESLRTGVKVLAGPSSTVGLGEFLRMTPRVPAVVWHHYKTKKNPNYIVPWAKPKLSVWCEQSPSSKSRISLSRKRDKLGLLKAEISWKFSELEVRTIRKYVEIATIAFAKHGIAKIVPDPDLNTDRITKRFSDQFHHCGGTRMAIRGQDGVVDPNLLLNGTNNVYVCSSSVFPSSGFTNPTHTVIALGARLVEHLNSKLSRRLA
jgi:choline dehydrogenase-like flavoprotein